LPAASREPIVSYVTDRKSLDSSGAVPNLLAKIRAAVAAGVDWVQIREKDLAARELLDLTRAAIGIAAEEANVHAKATRQARPRTTSTPVRILVNDRVDVALAACSIGVHLGGGSVQARDVIRWLRDCGAPADFVVGVSCHSLEEVRAAEDAGASYAFFGPVFDSPAKRSFGLPQGVSRLEVVCRSVKMPVLAIGGVNPDNFRECLSAGASGIAAIRLFQQPEASEGDLKMKVDRLHELLKSV
jgi:thiamine-phosphate pyrophosphorylase